MLTLGIICALLASAFALDTDLPAPTAKRCTGTISSLADVAAAQVCTTIIVHQQLHRPGQTFAINAATGATITMAGDVTFGFAEWAGPLMLVSGQNVTFNGNGHTLFGRGDLYWLGGNGGVTKPAPFIRVNNAGSFSNVRILNAPERSVAVKGSQVTISGIMIDNSLGDLPNSRSNGLPAGEPINVGHNTDGFGISNANNVIIQNSSVHNQDDCLAVNGGTNITFQNNVCVGGHGISIGSIASNVVVNNVHITENTVMNNTNGLRIKTDATATASTVSDIVYTDNKLSGITEFGVLIDQSYPDTLGLHAGTGVVINGVTFSGTNTISVTSVAQRVSVNCGSTGSCFGTWNFAALTVTGGAAGTIRDAPVTGGLF
ncbi:glycosyl hydrolases family 28-domain-containing protein [Mycena metata]|uniref:endo-polygalacturonase n=1 Tax=Mycena metata TaxID=1033252 RepID=A0AAD7MVC2_9AGAR|nr:glycosyl hydrolases family 28-domain-containing protein [Mycena metata]